MNRGSIDWQICDELMDCPAGMTVLVLADELGACPKAVYAGVKRLEKDGLIEMSGGMPRERTGRPQIIWSMKRTKRIAA